MPSIESLGHPLAYRVEPRDLPVDSLPTDTDVISVRVSARALDGMQKEAIVQYGPTGAIWRMVADEGPALNGTNLAPSPLMHHTAGMTFSFLEEVLRHAAADGVAIRSLTLTEDNYYIVEGSAIRGDMIAGAKPVAMEISIDANASEEAITEIIRKAELSSPAHAYMRDVLTNTFALCREGRQIPTQRVSPSLKDLYDNPEPILEAAAPVADGLYEAGTITKLREADTVFKPEGGPGSHLQPEQKRTVHIRGIATLREDGLKEATIQHRNGTAYHFLSDSPATDGGKERAPSALAYLSAGIAFCFMTQLGRYAHIVKMPVDAYSVVQDNVYRLDHRLAGCDPVDTHVFIRSPQSDEDVQQMVNMGEQMCFLHGALSSSVPSEIKVKMGDREVTV